MDEDEPAAFQPNRGLLYIEMDKVNEVGELEGLGMFNPMATS